MKPIFRDSWDKVQPFKIDRIGAKIVEINIFPNFNKNINPQVEKLKVSQITHKKGHRNMLRQIEQTQKNILRQFIVINVLKVLVANQNYE